MEMTKTIKSIIGAYSILVSPHKRNDKTYEK